MLTVKAVGLKRVKALEPGGVISLIVVRVELGFSKISMSKLLQSMKPALMKPALMTIQQSRLTHMKENPATIQACNVLKA